MRYLFKNSKSDLTAAFTILSHHLNILLFYSFNVYRHLINMIELLAISYHFTLLSS